MAETEDVRQDSWFGKFSSGETPRRSFFRALASVGSGVAAGLAGWKLTDAKSAEAAPLPPPLAEPTGNVIRRMQQELEETIASHRTPSWLMVVDTRKCIGCNACVVACRAEYPTGPGASFRRVVQKELSLGVRNWAVFKPMNCLQCDDPPCAKAVPAGMVRKRPDGIVEFAQDQLRGAYARAAASACPFKAVHVDDGRTFTGDTPVPQDYEHRAFVENGKTYTRRPGVNALEGAARKCTFCSHRLDIRLLPACVATCVGGAMYFGDGNNPANLVNEITGGRLVFNGHQNQGVGPRVLYFEESLPGTLHIPCGSCHL